MGWKTTLRDVLVGLAVSVAGAALLAAIAAVVFFFFPLTPMD
jgi:hypothetical protein